LKLFTGKRLAVAGPVIVCIHPVSMRTLPLPPDDEARAAVLAWAESKGITAREERGWIILEMGNREPDPMLRLMSEVLKGSA
jgi:hypothetical protein